INEAVDSVGTASQAAGFAFTTDDLSASAAALAALVADNTGSATTIGGLADVSRSQAAEFFAGTAQKLDTSSLEFLQEVDSLVPEDQGSDTEEAPASTSQNNDTSSFQQASGSYKTASSFTLSSSSSSSVDTSA
ncbi:MAG: hypothetical protein AB7G06_09710, partial [Bdellovibrionales bacterium]